MTKLNSLHEERQAFDVIVVGAGFSGLYLLHKLREEGFSVVVLEAGTDIGGTWYWNRYPGARCDMRSVEYSYSFSEDIQRDWNWTERFATQPEILSYLDFVAERLDLRSGIEFNTSVTAAHFDPAGAMWTVRTQDGVERKARYCIMATGCLSASKLPEIPGIDEFAGEIYHTGRWPHQPVDFAGKIVGVIGTGSSGIQAIPCIAEQAGKLFVFQRTPAYSVPARNAPLSEDFVAKWKAEYPSLRAKARETRSGALWDYGTKSAMEVSAEEREAEFARRWADGSANFLYAFNDLVRDPDSNEAAAAFVRARIAEIVHDPATAKKLTPVNYPIGAKRICVDSDYFETFNRDNVELVDVKADPIKAITRAGVKTAAKLFPVDILVFATGFDAFTGALGAIDIRGVGNLSLRAAWEHGPKTYLGMTVAGFPNLFLITGPGSPSVLGNMVVSIEHDVEWITACIAMMRKKHLSVIEANPEAQEQWVEHVRHVADGTLYYKADSWFIGANVPGKPRVFMPYVGGVDAFQRECREVVAEGYRGFHLA